MSRKAANVLKSFVKPNQVLGQDQIIPPAVLQNAKGLAIITVFKAGFLFSGRTGSGIIVARQRSGQWSAPSAVAIAGAGAGGMVGVELTDFIFILNTAEAVKSFAEFGTITLGGNMSVAAGPFGRNAEADASASAGGVAAIFSYSKSKGLFAGISVEGSAIIERREANRKIYGDNCTSKLILSGRVQPPATFDTLYDVLNSRAFSSDSTDYYDSDFYSDIPNSFRTEYFSGENIASHSKEGHDNDSDSHPTRHRHHNDRERASDRLSCDREYDRKFNDNDQIDIDEDKILATNDGLKNNEVESGKKMRALALYDFNGVEMTDLAFKKGDIIEVIKKTDTQNDWWYGNLNNKTGNFPANYVEII